MNKRYLVEVIYPMPLGGRYVERAFDHWLSAQRFADAHKDEGADTKVWDLEEESVTAVFKATK